MHYITEILISLVVGYLLGSIPFALVIGKVFFRKDIRQYGSKNLGGGNAGRVLGKKAGLAVMTLDILKVTLAIFLASFLPHASIMTIVAGLAAAAGHCYPLFAKFRGGKAVATMYGFLFGMMLFQGFSPWIFFLPLLVFLVILYLTKIIALASIGSAIINTVFIGLTANSSALCIASAIFAIVIVLRHNKNIERILHGEENKISWM